MTESAADSLFPVPDRQMIEMLRAKGRELYAEFSRTPIGKHTPNLQFILQLFRGSPLTGKYVLLALEPHRRWRLAELTGVRGNALRELSEYEFADLEEAERVVYRLRWQRLTGDRLDP